MGLPGLEPVPSSEQTGASYTDRTSYSVRAGLPVSRTAMRVRRSERPMGASMRPRGDASFPTPTRSSAARRRAPRVRRRAGRTHAERATTSRPLVSRSSRCTMPGRMGSPTAISGQRDQALHERPLRWPAPGARPVRPASPRRSRRRRRAARRPRRTRRRSAARWPRPSSRSTTSPVRRWLPAARRRGSLAPTSACTATQRRSPARSPGRGVAVERRRHHDGVDRAVTVTRHAAQQPSFAVKSVRTMITIALDGMHESATLNTGTSQPRRSR